MIVKEYSVVKLGILNLGHQFDHKATKIQFIDFNKMRDDSTVYLKVDGLGMYPLFELSFEVSQAFTLKEGKLLGQLLEISPDNELLQNSNVFTMIVRESLDENTEIVEETPELDLWFTEMSALYQEVQRKLDAGEFKGDPGEDGFSPTVDVEEITRGHRVTITDKEGANTFDVIDGKDGADGPIGPVGPQGERGSRGLTGPMGPQGDMGPTGPKGDPFTYADFTPEQLAGLKGPKGDKGDTGYTPIKGKDYFDGAKGDKGDPFTYSDFTPAQLEALRGPKGETGPQGKVGPQGPQGVKGDTGTAGKDGVDGKDGIDGKTPVRGVDYFTTADKAEMVDEIKEEFSDDISGINTRLDTLDGETLDIYGKLENKADASDVYTKEQSNALLSQKASTGDLTALNTLLTDKINQKQNKLVEGKNIHIDPVTNEISADGGGGEGDVTKEYLEENYYDKDFFNPLDTLVTSEDGEIVRAVEEVDISYSNIPVYCGKWVDGKDIHRRVYVVTSGVAMGNQVKVAGKPANMDLLIRGFGIIKATSAASNAMTNSNITVFVNDNGVFATNNFTSYCDRLYVILEYTVTGGSV